MLHLQFPLLIFYIRIGQSETAGCPVPWGCAGLALFTAGIFGVLQVCSLCGGNLHWFHLWLSLGLGRMGVPERNDPRGSAKTTLPLLHSHPVLTPTVIPWPRLSLLGFGVINRPQTKEVILLESSPAT